MFCSLHFFCICLTTKIMSTVPLLNLNPHWLSGMFSCAVFWMSLFSETQARSQDFACNGGQSDASIMLILVLPRPEEGIPSYSTINISS